MGFKKVKLVSEIDSERFEEEFAAAMKEIGNKETRVTFDATAVASGEDGSEVEVYYNAFIEY